MSYALRPINWPSNAAKMLVWDIEMMSHGYNPSMGEVLCVGFQHPDWAEPRVVKYNDFEGAYDLDICERDKYLCEWIEREFAEAEILVGHYAFGFDRPVMNARLLHHGLRPFVVSQDVDTYRMAKKNFAPGKRNYNEGLRCSLRGLAKFLGLQEQKEGIDEQDWRRVMTNDYPELVDAIANYCKQDVRTTLELFHRLKVLPGCAVNLTLAAGGRSDHQCAVCGSQDVQGRGTRTTTTHVYPRFQCNTCGKWGRGRKTLLSPSLERHMPL
jgi:hypothetical protein